MEISKKSIFFTFSLIIIAFSSIFILGILLPCHDAISQEIIGKSENLTASEQLQKPTLELLRNQVEIENFTPPNISITNSEGESVPLKSFRGKFVLMYFFATWCSSCSEELKALDKLKTNADFLDIDDFTIVPVSEDYKDSNHIQAHYKALKIKNLNFYLDPNKQVMGMLGVRTMPTTLLIDHNGNIFAKIDKNVNWSKKEIVNDVLHLIEQKREQSKEALSKKQYDLKTDQDIIFHKETSKKVTIIN